MPNKTYNKVQLRVKFTQASDRANIGNTDTNGENIAVSFGKLSKWYEALVPTGGSSGKILAWNSSGTAKWSDPLHPSVTKSADTTSTASPAHGGTFTTVDTVTRDAYGHVTKINTKTITLPADTNTDTKVIQSQTTTTNYRPILFGANNSTDVSTLANTITDQAYTSTKMFAKPDTGNLYATEFITSSYLSGTGADLAPYGLYLKSQKQASLPAGGNYGYARYALRVHDGKAVDNNGMLLTMDSGGLTIVGSGESATALATLISDDQRDSNTSRTRLDVGGTLNTAYTGTNEQLILSSDSNIYLLTNCNTIADRKPVVLDTASRFYPGTTNTGSIGIASYQWNTIYGKTIFENGTSLASKYAPISHTHTQYYDSTISRTANTVLAAPNGSDGTASFRKLVAADLPDSYLSTSGGTVSGTLVLSKTQDASGTANNSPALIVGGAATSTHLELDANEIMAKTNGTSTAALYINNDGGNVYINNNLAARHTATPTSGQVVITDGTGGGIKSSGYTIAKSVPSNAVFTDHITTVTSSGSGNAVTAISADANGALTVTKGSTFSLSTHTHSNYLPMSTVSSSTDADTLFTTSQWINWNTTTEVETTHMPTTNYGILLAKAYPGIQVFIPDTAGGIYFRKKTNANTAATAWWGITGTAGNTYNLNNFLPLSGGTMTGDIVYPHSDGRSSTMTNSGMTYKIAQSNNWAMGLTYVNSGGTHVGFIGAYGTTDAFESIRFGAKYNDWWMEITDTKTTITGDLVFSTVTSTTYPAKSKMISFGGSTDWGRIYYRVDASDAGRLVLDIGDDSNARIDFAYNGTTKSHIDTSGNFSGNAYSATNVNITVTNGSTTTTNYGIIFAANPNTTENNTLRKTNDFRYQMKDGAANTEGFATIVLGNTKKLSEANNKSGNIYLYSSGGNWHLINTTSTTSNITHTLPATSGTILNSGTTSFTRTLSSGTKIGTIKINGTSTDLYCQTNTNTTYTLGTSGNNVTLTPSSGNVQSITVPYATNAATSDSLKITGYGTGNLTFYQANDDFGGTEGRKGNNADNYWSHYIIANHGNGETYYHYTLRLPFWGSPQYQRKIGGSTATANRTRWLDIITEENYTEYTYSATASRTANTVLAAPNGSAGAATFRKLVAADIPSLNYVPNTNAGVNAAINLLTTGSSNPTLTDYYIAQYAGGGTTTTTYHRRPISALWNTFKELITLTTTGSGNAVTAISIANDGDHNRKITVTKGSTFSLSTHTHNSLYGAQSSTAVPVTSLSNGQLKVFYNVNYDLSGNMPATNNANAIIQINRHGGNYDSQLGFSNNGNIYYRSCNNETLDTKGWKTVLDNTNSPAFDSIKQRWVKMGTTKGWRRILTMGASSTSGKTMNDIKIHIRRQYNNGTPESCSFHIVHNYTDTPSIIIDHAIQSTKMITQVRLSKSSDGKKVYVEINYDSTSVNDMTIRYDIIAPNGALGDSYYSNIVVPDNATTIAVVSDSPTAIYTADIPTNIAHADFILKTVNQNDPQYWGMTSPYGEDNIWVRTTSQGIIPYQSGASGSGHCYLGTSGWYFAHAYIDTVHALKYHGWYGQKTNDTRQSTANITCTGKGAMQLIIVSSTLTTGRPAADGYIMDFDWDNTGQYKAQLYIPNTATTNNGIQWRAQTNSSDWSAAACAWRSVLDNSNYTSYTVTKTGGGASGSWGISITGTANRATYLDVVASNEIRFYNDNQFKANNHFWIGYSWAQGSHYTPSGGTNTVSTTAPNITKYVMGNCSGGGLAGIHAASLILGQGNTPTSSSAVSTLKAAAGTTGTYLLPSCGNGTYTLSIGMMQVGGTGDSLVMSNVSGIPAGTLSFKIIFKSNATSPMYSMVEIPYIGDGVDCGGLIQVGDYSDGTQGSPRIVMKGVVIRVTAGSTTGTKTFTATVTPTQKISGSSVSEYTRNVIMYKIYACT